MDSGITRSNNNKIVRRSILLGICIIMSGRRRLKCLSHQFWSIRIPLLFIWSCPLLLPWRSMRRNRSSIWVSMGSLQLMELMLVWTASIFKGRGLENRLERLSRYLLCRPIISTALQLQASTTINKPPESAKPAKTSVHITPSQSQC